MFGFAGALLGGAKFLGEATGLSKEGRTTTQTASVAVPQASAEERELMEMFKDVYMPIYLDQIGYEYTPGELVPSDDPNVAYHRKSGTYRKKDSPKVEAIRKEYGPNSGEYRSALAAYKKEVIETEEENQKLEKTYREKSLKFLNGDFSINEQQRDLIQANMAPQRAALEKMYSEMDARSKEGFAAEQEVLDQFYGKIGETGIPADAALSAVGNQLLQSGGEMGKGLASLDQAFTNVIETNRQLLKMGIEDATGEITKNVSAQAASMGRDPSDPAYQLEMKQLVSREIQRGQLGLTQMEAQGRMGIQEQALALRGQEMGLRADLASRRGVTGTQIAQGRGAGSLGMEESATNLRYQLGGFMTPQQVGTGMNISQFQEALKQQQIQNIGTGMQFPLSGASGLAQLRYSAASKTATSTDPLSETVMGWANVGASAVGGGKKA